jgi:hypothetical protein
MIGGVTPGIRDKTLARLGDDAVRLEAAVLAAAAIAIIVATPKAFAAFDLIPVTPAERGSATALALAPVTSETDSAGAKGKPSVCVFGFKPHGMSELDFAAVSAEIPVASRIRNVGLSYRRFSALGYTEEVYVASAGFAAREAVVTPCVRVCRARADDWPGDWAVLLDISADSQLSPLLRARAYVDNALGSRLIRGQVRCPGRVGAGLGVAAAANLTFGIEIGKTAGFATTVASGVEFTPAKCINLRLGLRTCPKEFAFGAGVRLNRIAIDAGSSINLALGITHEAGATFFW